MAAKKAVAKAVSEVKPATKPEPVKRKPRKTSVLHYRYEGSVYSSSEVPTELSTAYTSLKDLMDDVSLTPPAEHQEIVIFRVVKRGKIQTKTKVTIK